MPVSVIEIAVYAMVLSASQPRPFECVEVQPQGVNCTNGLAADPLPEDGVRFNTGVTVTRGRNRELIFSNGIQVHLDASAWAQFQKDGATLISVRRMDARGSRFVFNNGYACQSVETTTARCYRQ